MQRLRPIGCLPLMMSFSDLVHTVPKDACTSNVDIPDAKPPKTMSLSVIHTGSIASKASRAFEGGLKSDIRSFGLYAVLIQHEKGRILLDAGAGKNADLHRLQLPWLMRKTTQFHQGTPAAAQLSEQGFSPNTIDSIFLTHAHWDHISGASDFHETPLWMTEKEQDFMKSNHRSMKVARDIQSTTIKTLKFMDSPYLGFDMSFDVWGDGSFVVVPAPGHTPGSIIAFVTLPSGLRIAFIGDIVWQMEGLDLEVPKPLLSRLIADHAPAEVKALIHRLAELRRQIPEMLFVPAHDQKMMGQLPTWPRTTLSR
jgi:N-acyl homoserine lactone hydrolase